MKCSRPTAPWLTLGCLWLGLFLLVMLAYQTALAKLATELTEQLPKVVDKALESNHGFQQKMVPYLLQQLNSDLSQIPLAPTNLVISHCSATVQQIGEGQAPQSQQLVQWNSGNHVRFVSVQPQCTINSKGVVALATLMVLPVLALLWWLPAPVSAQRESFIVKALQSGVPVAEALTLTVALQETIAPERLLFLQRLLQQKFSVADAIALALCQSEHFDPDCDLAWLQLGWRTYPADCEKAFQLAKAPATLEFQLSESCVIVHGLTIELPRTPLLYYYWYALQRINTAEGWVLNPASNKPDQPLAQDIIALMSQWQGHKKAIQDLAEQGLKAKTLDQNRSKIRDELVSVLGAELASAYLFDSQKSVRTGRFSYRLMTAPALIMTAPNQQAVADRDISNMAIGV